MEIVSKVGFRGRIKEETQSSMTLEVPLSGLKNRLLYCRSVSITLDRMLETTWKV